MSPPRSPIWIRHRKAFVARRTPFKSERPSVKIQSRLSNRHPLPWWSTQKSPCQTRGCVDLLESFCRTQQKRNYSSETKQGLAASNANFVQVWSPKLLFFCSLFTNDFIPSSDPWPFRQLLFFYVPRIGPQYRWASHT